ncbi:hypothetical protein OPV22_012274 [Ensete ventricosum]|uniref:Uncharacterized protein n=1 Tax=Ensete ventricosum TaxID=4639 RepID=A0AAV8PHC1_ENSVE|nr:hypothetical protein OPV22_012274 [Ensete ventricosum]
MPISRFRRPIRINHPSVMGCKPRRAFKSSLRPGDANGTSRTGSIDDLKGDCVNNVTRYVFSCCGCSGISSGPAKE